MLKSIWTLPTLAVIAGLAGCANVGHARATPTPPSASPLPTHPGAATSAGSTSPRPIPGASSNPGGLTDAQMVGQLFITYVYGSGPDTASTAQRAANIALYGEPTPAAIVRRWHLGGLILLDHNSLDPGRADLSTGNLTSPAQLQAFTAGLQAIARADTGLPLLIGTDQEGGTVQRIPFLPPRPAQETLAFLTPAAVGCSYANLGRQLLGLGVNQDYAPDADVIRVTGGVIGNRSFGPDPSLDALDVNAAVQGLQSVGVLATLKHWPGHGSTSTDSHAALAVIHETASQWRQIDRPPFAAAMGADAIMVGHLALPALDPSGLPASLSPTLLNGQLRHDLNYQGLVLTDSLWMQPVRTAGSPAAVALRAVLAGEDALLMPPALPQAWQGVLRAVQTQPGTRQAIQRAVRDLIAAKEKIGRKANSVLGC